MDTPQKPLQTQALDRSTNVTPWMKESILTFLADKGYTVVLFNINAEILARFDKITVINTFTIKITDPNGKLLSLSDYCSTNTEYDNQSLKWLVDFVKEKEMEAILKFGGSLLGTEKVGTPKDSLFEVEGEKKFGSLRIDICFCSTVDEISKFITAPEFYPMWMGPTTKASDALVSFENITLGNIKSSDGIITLDYKWSEWKEFSKVTIDLVQIGDNVKVALRQSRVPISLIDSVKMHWNSRIFGVISNIFGCAIKYI